MLKLADLTMRPDFQVGPMLVSPARRLVEGPGGYIHVEPLIMQVFLLLLDGSGRVVTRNELFDQCWGGVYVGDDSLNRAIAKVRRIGAQIAPGLFEIETIPRTGYRLTSALTSLAHAPDEQSAVPRRLSRRQLAGGALGLLAVGGAGIWAAVRSRQDQAFDALIARGEGAMRKGQWNRQTAAIFKQALSIRSDSARAWGLLALCNTGVAQGVDAQEAPAVVEEAQAAARRALAIDPQESNALMAMFELQGSTLDWAARDRRLRQIIAIDPRSTVAIAELVLLLQAAGLNRESWNWNERALALDPLSVDYLSKRALKLWIAGRVSEADKVIDQVRALDPANPAAWWVRFVILALTGRPRAAQAMLDGEPRMVGSAREASIWRAGLIAIDLRTPAAIARAREACIDGATNEAWLAGVGVMLLSELGEVDTAFDICNGFLLSRGSIVRKDKAGSTGAADDATFRINTQWLFTPPCAAMRADRRFLLLCEAVGLADYWRSRGVRPDYLLKQA